MFEAYRGVGTQRYVEVYTKSLGFEAFRGVGTQWTLRFEAFRGVGTQ